MEVEAEESRIPLGFHRYFAVNTAENTLKISTDIPFGVFIVLTTNSSVKTAKHPSTKIFLDILGAEDAALLTQGKDDKSKITRKDG